MPEVFFKSYRYYYFLAFFLAEETVFTVGLARVLEATDLQDLLLDFFAVQLQEHFLLNCSTAIAQKYSSLP